MLFGVFLQVPGSFVFLVTWELFCFLSFITIVLRNLCSGTHRRNRFLGLNDNVATFLASVSLQWSILSRWAAKTIKYSTIKYCFRLGWSSALGKFFRASLFSRTVYDLIFFIIWDTITNTVDYMRTHHYCAPLNTKLYQPLSQAKFYYRPWRSLLKVKF